MFSFQQLFGKGDRFQDLLEQASKEANESARLLMDLIRTPENTRNMDDLVLARRKEKRIAEQISEELVKTFVTSLEREDIEALSHSLYKIPKTVEKFAERYILCAPRLRDIDFGDYLARLTEATDTLFEMVHTLRKKSDLEEIKELNSKLQKVEGDADKLMLTRLRDLYGGAHEPMKAVILKDLYELLEKIFDRCRDAGNIVFHIILKHS